MTTFTVWKFDDPEGAQAAAAILKGVEAERLIKVLDHAVVTWPVGSPGPTLKRTHDSTWHDTGWGALWGLLIGSLFFVPLLGGAVWDATGLTATAFLPSAIGAVLVLVLGATLKPVRVDG